ncbi:MAG TPA: hypothetical protein VK668_09135 [Mucilaginibacter sp.]|nr:hypothetical protein [Mucilaginibacter sp.]
MKKSILLFLPLFALLVLFSCKKSSKSSINTVGTITATIDGNQQTFNVGATAQLQNNGGSNSLSIIGVQGSGNSNSLIMLVTNNGPITTGTYTGADSKANLSYTTTNSLIYQNDDSDVNSNATIVISSITSTNVQGTFSGKLVLITGNGAATATITSGTFNLAVQ